MACWPNGLWFESTIPFLDTCLVRIHIDRRFMTKVCKTVKVKRLIRLYLYSLSRFTPRLCLTPIPAHGVYIVVSLLFASIQTLDSKILSQRKCFYWIYSGNILSTLTVWKVSSHVTKYEIKICKAELKKWMDLV